MLTQFRTCYPHGSLISELITIDRGQYIVKVTLQVDGVVLSTGLAAADKIETAEDNARKRALLALALDSTSSLPDSAVAIANHPDQVINNSSNEESTTSRQLSITENEANQVKPLPINTPPIVSTASPLETIDSVVNNHSVEPSNPPQEIDKTDFNSSPNDLPLSAVPLANQELTSETSPEKLDNSLPEVPSTQTLETVEFDFNDIKNRTDVEIKRLGWTKDQGRDFLLQTYGKRSRLHLTDQELMDFLYYLESQPT